MRTDQLKQSLEESLLDSLKPNKTKKTMREALQRELDSLTPDGHKPIEPETEPEDEWI